MPHTLSTLVVALACTAACSGSKTPVVNDSGVAEAMVKMAKPGFTPASAPASNVSQGAVLQAVASPSTPNVINYPNPANADRDFLRKLSDHHKGMIAMAHLTKDSKQKLSVKPLAVRIDAEHDGEMDKILTMLEKDFKDPYAPKISAADQASEDDLRTKTGTAYERAFLEHAIAHGTQARGMIDAYLPNALNAAARTLAASIRTRLVREIPEFTTLLANTAK